MLENLSIEKLEKFLKYLHKKEKECNNSEDIFENERKLIVEDIRKELIRLYNSK